MTRALILLSLIMCVTTLAQDVLQSLRKEHPRLLVSPDAFEKAMQSAQRDPSANVYYKQIQSDCAKFLSQPPPRRGSGKMLNTSRTALGRITFLATLYRM